MVDWKRFLDVARNHRVEALAYYALSSTTVAVPDAVASKLARRARSTAQNNLRLAAEAVRVSQAFAGVPHVFVKGTTLGILAYGDHQLKSASDIDVLVPLDAIERASAILTTLGYLRIVPDSAMPVARFRRWQTYYKEALWRHVVTGSLVDLHWALSDSKRLLAGIGLNTPQQRVRIAEDIELPTLAPNELFAYLCVHGTYHGWSRLKWLADVAALAGDDEMEINRLHRAAVGLGAGRCSAVALLLANRLLSKALPIPLLTEFRADRAVLQLESTALSRISGLGESGDGLGVNPRETLRLHASHLLLETGFHYAIAELGRKVTHPYHAVDLAAPTWLRPVFSVLRLLLNRRT